MNCTEGGGQGTRVFRSFGFGAFEEKGLGLRAYRVVGFNGFRAFGG